MHYNIYKPESHTIPIESAVILVACHNGGRTEMFLIILKDNTVNHISLQKVPTSKCT